MARKVTIAEIEELAIEQLKVGHAVMFLGPAGVGKTETAQRIAKQLGLEDIFILNASQFSKEDLGIPAKDSTGQHINILTHPIDNHLILIDELTNANPALMGALLSLVLEHRIGNKKFENIKIIATGNRTDESTLAATLPRPLIERFAVFDFPVPSISEWVDYMLTYKPDKAHGYYLNFLNKAGAGGGLFFGDDDAGEVTDFVPRPSPRGHSRVSTLLRKFYPTRNAILDNAEKVGRHIYALVGPDVSSSFMGFLQDERNHLTLEDFLAGRKPENATQYMHLILDASTVLRLPRDFEFKDKKAVKEYVKKVVEPLNKIIGAGLDRAEFRRLAALASRYITGLTTNENVKLEDTFALLQELITESAKQFGSDAPLILLRNQRVRSTQGHKKSSV